MFGAFSYVTSLVQIHQLGKNFYVGDDLIPVLTDINLTIESGEFIAISGPSGSGKSTLMNIIGLLDEQTSGLYTLAGSDVSNLSDDQRSLMRNRSIGFVFQSFYLLPRLTVLDNIGLPLLYQGMPREAIRERALAMLVRFGLQGLAGRKPDQLSGGQQQRVAIARALIAKPKLLLADEPTGALDTKTGQAIIDLFFDLNQQEQITIVLVTHDETISDQCQRIVRVIDGSLHQGRS